jgi:hypothetical protein
MSVFDKWLKGIEERNADTLIDLLHDDFEFVRHQSGASLNKAQMSEMIRQIPSNRLVVPKGAEMPLCERRSVGRSFSDEFSGWDY